LPFTTQLQTVNKLMYKANELYCFEFVLYKKAQHE